MDKEWGIILFAAALMLSRGIPLLGQAIPGVHRVNKVMRGTGKIFSNFYTLFHEDGHALVGMLVGKVSRIDLYANAEGVAEVMTKRGLRGWIPRILVAIAGYPVGSLAAYGFCYLLFQGKYEWLFYGLIGVLLINLVLWVRNLYGIAWLVSMLGVMGWIYYEQNPELMAYSMMFIGAVLLIESVYAALEILVLSIKTPYNAGDATSLGGRVLAPLWGFLFFAQAVWVGYLIIEMWKAA